jgi:hypothetical protein
MSIGTLILRLVQAIILILICIPLLWGCLTAFEPEVILFQAGRIAGDRPYCIAVSDRDRNLPSYKVAENRSDLTYSALITHVDYSGSGAPKASGYYALLILKNPDEMRNWSKLHLNFESDVNPLEGSIFRRDISKLCTPVVDFAKSIRY